MERSASFTKDHSIPDFAVVVPMANEEDLFDQFVAALSTVLDRLGSGQVYFVVDNVSRDRTRALCEAHSRKDGRFLTVWAPGNRNVVDAYLRGYREAYDRGHPFIIEMDAGLSHDPESLPAFLGLLQKGYDCVLGSRFVAGGSISNAPWKRLFLSKGGTLLTNLMLGIRIKDLTSGYQGFRRGIVEKFLAYPLRSEGHFYQTELRYLLRKTTYIEIPIHYQAPSPSVSRRSVLNSVKVLLYYFHKRILGQSIAIGLS